MANIVESIRNIFKIEELRQRLVYTLLALIAVRVGSFITIPGVDVELLRAASSSGDSGGLFGLFDMFVGGAFSNAAVFALGIMPYISASIILQIAGVVLPELQRLQRQGDDGRRKINQYTRYLTVGLAALQSWGVTIKVAQTTANGMSVVADPTFFWTISSILILTGGTIGLMWIGEQITERGIGNGISLIIMIGIIAQFPIAMLQEYNLIESGARNLVIDIVLLLLLAGIIGAVVLVTQGARRIPVQYAKRQVGRKVYGGGTQYIPLRVNTAGVMPIIFAQSILFVPATVASFFPDNQTLQALTGAFNPQSFWYALIYGVIILFFTYFYTAITFNPKEVADNMKKNGGFIPGIRPGAHTSEYIENILTRITLPGAIFLAIVAILPTLAMNLLQVPPIFASFFGGTSLLIVVGVALDTLQQIESHLLMRHYDGFMKSGKMRGRAGALGGGM